MLDLLGGITVGDVGLSGFAIIVCLLIVTGAVPTRRELRDSQARETRAMDLADKWQKVATEQGMTLHRLLDYAEAADHAITEIQSALLRPHDKEASP